MVARDFGPWQYITNNGREFVRRADKFITAQEAVAGTTNVGGFSAATLPVASYESMPANWRPRAVVMGAPGKPRHTVVCYSNTCPLWIQGTPPTMLLRDGDGTTATYTVERRVDEKLGKVIGRGQ